MCVVCAIMYYAVFACTYYIMKKKYECRSLCNLLAAASRAHKENKQQGKIQNKSGLMSHALCLYISDIRVIITPFVHV